MTFSDSAFLSLGLGKDYLPRKFKSSEMELGGLDLDKLDAQELADSLEETLSASIEELEATVFDKVRHYAEMKEMNDPSSDRALRELRDAKEKLSSFMKIQELLDELS